jgi:hypothetical protein
VGAALWPKVTNLELESANLTDQVLFTIAAQCNDLIDLQIKENQNFTPAGLLLKIAFYS